VLEHRTPKGDRQVPLEFLLGLVGAPSGAISPDPIFIGGFPFRGPQGIFFENPLGWICRNGFSRDLFILPIVISGDAALCRPCTAPEASSPEESVVPTLKIPAASPSLLAEQHGFPMEEGQGHSHHEGGVHQIAHEGAQIVAPHHPLSQEFVETGSDVVHRYQYLPA